MQVSKQSVTLLLSSCNEIWNRLDSLLVKIFSVKFYETPFSSFRVVTFRLADKCITHFLHIFFASSRKPLPNHDRFVSVMAQHFL